MNMYNNWLATLVFLILTLNQQVSSFTNTHEYYTIKRYISGIKSSSILQPLSSSNDDDWGFDDVDDPIPDNEDPRLQAMKSLLESSWDANSMGKVPTDPQNGAEAAGECVASALANNKNILMIDLRLPSYDITEGSKLYDLLGVYDFCTFLSDNLKKRNLIRKSLLLVRNEKERAEIDRVVSQRGELTTTKTTLDDDRGEEKEEGNSEVNDFRKQLMSSWDDNTSSGDNDTRAEDDKAVSKTTPQQKKISNNNNSSHRLCSMVGNSEIGTGTDSFDEVIDAVDNNAILKQDEDALIIMSPYDIQDVIALRRTLARYGNTRTIIIVNSRIEQIPRELDSGLLVYGVMPLVARSKESDNESGLKVVVMKRFPVKDWSVYVDVYDDGFVEARGPTQRDISDKAFPSSEWITQRVEAHVQGLPSNKDNK